MPVLRSVGVLLAVWAAFAAPTSAQATTPRFSHVVVLMLENRSYGQIIGSRKAPFLNRLAKRYALATNYYALAHPSLPNYIALTGGSTFGIHHNCDRCDVEAPNLVNQLEAAGISWKAYFGGLPRAGYLGGRRPGGFYSKHLNPFAYYSTVGGTSSGRRHIVPLRRLGRDIRAAGLPRLTWVSPNLCQDGHLCSRRHSDRYLARLVPRLVAALGSSGVLFITWDEAARRDHSGLGGRGGGHIPLIAAGPDARPGFRFALPANHYSLLRTLELGFDVPPLGHAAAPTTQTLFPLLRG